MDRDLVVRDRGRDKCHRVTLNIASRKRKRKRRDRYDNQALRPSEVNKTKRGM